MFSLLKKWAEFVRFSHTLFALPFALAAMAVAARDDRGWPGLRLFVLILLAMVCARTCAMAFNRIVDRKFDAANPRTALRHLPTGQICLASAWTLWALSAAGFVATTWFINPLCFHLSPVALLVICFYSLTKRFTHYTHVFLGLALALAPVGACGIQVRFIPTALGARERFARHRLGRGGLFGGYSRPQGLRVGRHRGCHHRDGALSRGHTPARGHRNRRERSLICWPNG